MCEATKSQHKPEKQTLLSKYQIPATFLDFDYIEKCQNGKELERILKILKSGEEGYYPQLIEVTEKRLTLIKPNSKLLNKQCPVLTKQEIGKDVWLSMSNDIVSWVDNITKQDEELKANKSAAVDVDSEIRKLKDLSINIPKRNPDRIGSTDYASWDKYDPDTEILKMDLEEEKIRNNATKNQKQKVTPKTVTFNNYTTEAELIFEATREKEKGNDCFKANEYKYALQHYTNSLKFKKSAVGYTNRAVTYNKLGKYNLAINDCKAALKLEPQNFKAFLRMAQAQEQLKLYEKSHNNIEEAIRIDPNNTAAQQLANRLQKHLGHQLVTKRFIVQEVDTINETNFTRVGSILKTSQNGKVPEGSHKALQNDKYCTENNVESNDNTHESIVSSPRVQGDNPSIDSKHTGNLKNDINRQSCQFKNQHKNFEVISIAGSSKMGPPYTKTIRSNDPQIIQQEQWEINAPRLLHMTTIDSDTDEDYLIHNNEISTKCATQTLLSKSATSDKKTSQLKNRNFKKSQEMNVCRDKQELKLDSKAGGDSLDIGNQNLSPTTEELQSAFSFMQWWNSIKKDYDFTMRANMLRKINFQQISDVIGYKLDDTMLSNIIECLYRHFTVAGEVEIIFSALIHIPHIPRFKTILLFLKEEDWMRINHLIEFLDQHGSCLPDNIRILYTSSA